MIHKALSQTLYGDWFLRRMELLFNLIAAKFQKILDHLSYHTREKKCFSIEPLQ